MGVEGAAGGTGAAAQADWRARAELQLAALESAAQTLSKLGEQASTFVVEQQKRIGTCGGAGLAGAWAARDVTRTPARLTWPFVSAHSGGRLWRHAGRGDADPHNHKGGDRRRLGGRPAGRQDSSSATESFTLFFSVFAPVFVCGGGGCTLESPRHITVFVREGRKEPGTESAACRVPWARLDAA